MWSLFGGTMQLPQDNALFNKSYKIVPIEVGIRYGRKQALIYEKADFFIIDVKFLPFDTPKRDTLKRPDKKILEVGHFFLFAADTLNSTTGIFSRFLALVTEH
jgi:hypothetical protein